MRARCTPKYTFPSPAPTQLKKSCQNRLFSFLENDAGHWKRLPAENGKVVFPPLKRNHTHSHQDPSERFLLIKNVREEKLGYRPPETVPLMKTVGRLRTQTLRENDGPIGIPIEDAQDKKPCRWIFFWENTPFAMQSNAKIDQCVETRLWWNWPK